MAAYPTEMFIYDKIFFENGRKDQIEHPVVIAGADEENAYCFVMTSQIKNNENIPQIKKYPKNIEYETATSIFWLFYQRMKSFLFPLYS